jgi:pre-rRNA-processing protein IPI1
MRQIRVLGLKVRFRTLKYWPLQAEASFALIGITYPGCLQRMLHGSARAFSITLTDIISEAIAIKEQSLSTSAPTVGAQCAHHLGLLRHKSDTQRRDSLAYLTTVMSTHPPSLPLPVSATTVIPAAQPLMTDRSNAVRQQLLKLLQSLPKDDIAYQADKLQLHIRVGMTHIATDVRFFALDVLEWLLGVAGEEVVSCAGGWMKTLKSFMVLLCWQSDNLNSKWSTLKSSGKTGDEAKLVVKLMTSLTSFLRVGLLPPLQTTAADMYPPTFPLTDAWHHAPPHVIGVSNPFARLNLFGPPRDEESEMYESREDRQRIFRKRVETQIIAGLEQATMGGGQMGRAAAQLRKVVNEGMADCRHTRQD